MNTKPIAMMLLLMATASALSITMPASTEIKTENGIQVSRTGICDFSATEGVCSFYLKVPNGFSGTVNAKTAFTAKLGANFTICPITSIKNETAIMDKERNETDENGKTVIIPASTFLQTRYETGSCTGSTLNAFSAKEFIVQTREPLTRKEGKTLLPAKWSFTGNIGTASFDPDPGAPPAILSSANTIYTMTADYSGVANGYNITGTNITLDCDGHHMAGSNVSGTRGIYATGQDVKIRNCDISNFAFGIYLSTGDRLVENSNVSTTLVAGRAIHSPLFSNGIIRNNTLYTTVGRALQISGAANKNNTVYNNTLTATGNGNALEMETNPGQNRFENNTFISSSGAAIYLFSKTNSSIFVNNTIKSTTGILLAIDSSSGNNTFYWNNFSNTSGLYVQDDNGSNFYNSTINGQNEGNIYFNMNSSNLSGTSQSTGFPNYKVATSGASYPYQNTTSGGKITCAGTNGTGCVDYAPLFYSPGEAPTSCTCPASGNYTEYYDNNCVLTSVCSVSIFTLVGGCGQYSIRNGGALYAQQFNFQPSPFSKCSVFSKDNGGIWSRRP